MGVKMTAPKPSRLLSSAIVAIGVTMLVAPPTQAQTITAYKSGEATTGMTKQCYYDALGNQYTKTISSVALCPLSIQVSPTPTFNSPAPPVRQSGGTAFKTGEQSTGMTKQCFYDYLGNQHSITISSVALCPLSIRVGN